MATATTSVTKVGGVTIVTQFIPGDDSSPSIPLQSPASPEATPPPLKAPPTPTRTEKKAAIFLRGEPQALGVVQVFVGLLGVLFSLTAAYSPALIRYAPLASAAAFLVSGSLAVAAGRRTSVVLVWASLLSNVSSVLVALGGVAYLCCLLGSAPAAQVLCGPRSPDPEEDKWTKLCMGLMGPLNVVLYGILFLLQVAVAAAVCVFSGKVIRRYRRYCPVQVEADDVSRLLTSAPGSSDHLITG